MSKRAVCVGINDYPGVENDLNGCVNDARAWAAVLIELFGFSPGDVRLILDGEATLRNILSALDELIGGGRSGDVLVFVYSGHGTWIPDTGVKDEVDGRDEALVPCEADFGRLILDDDLRSRLERIGPGTSFTFIADSCYSGTVTRLLPGRAREGKVRFYPPPLDLTREVGPSSPLKKRISNVSEGRMGEIFMSAARDDEPAAEDIFEGVSRGVFSYFAIKTLRESGPGITYEEWCARIRSSITGAGFSQSPQLEGPSRLKCRQVFSPVSA
ncbi:MAG: caspase family protein [Candidatus Aureabacteria bacterium]|nr:caspase family protein [Candidatus Auribacterota bacterium]